MNGSSFEKVLLSSILTSCAVFSVLTVALVPRRADPVLTEPTGVESIEDVNHRDVVIRHIGLSIVLSVGAGITTAELMRKWKQSRTVAPDGRQVLSAQPTLQAVDMPDMTLAVNGLTDSFRGLVDRLESQSHAKSFLDADRDRDWDNAALPDSLFASPKQRLTEDTNWFLPAQTNSLSPAPLLELNSHTTDWAPTWHPILASREQYETCRIYRSDAPERLFAILFDGEHYRFVKTATDREQALKIANRLDQRGEPAVITHDEERYTVWALESDAHMEAMVCSLPDSATCCCAESLTTLDLVAPDLVVHDLATPDSATSYLTAPNLVAA